MSFLPSQDGFNVRAYACSVIPSYDGIIHKVAEMAGMTHGNQNRLELSREIASLSYSEAEILSLVGDKRDLAAFHAQESRVEGSSSFLRK